MLAWLLDVLQPMKRTSIKQLLQHGQISVNGKPTTRFDYPLRPGDTVTLSRTPNDPARRDLDRSGIAIIHEDEAVIVIDKPAGLLTVATEGERVDTAFAWLNAYLNTKRLGRPFVVHRLDRETSGLLIFARTQEIRDQLQVDWENVAKTYLATVEGVPTPAEGGVQNFLTEGRDFRVRASDHERPGAKFAITRYRVVAKRGTHSLLEVVIETGRKHQIRVHLAGLGHPVIGDTVYEAKSDPAGRLGLHAWRLAFNHPVTGKRIELEAPHPTNLRRIVS
ncbi:Ribosomal large subunit pseudouridine synthase D [Fimbriiglobus ruber]|uniref:Pseudouridine synthase n=1 Tax=Fimbriiglobus ruber TaxID=1908690 RepID=A0A225E4G2_9BACT|nr:Ribosomal large subunit pseudouridine synthase D [Fimbriiglobus ruber]